MFGPIKLSKNHWRYRILHWAMGEDQPKFLYTHYCPLFHLTNVLVLVFPLILLAKLVISLMYLINALFNTVPMRQLGNALMSITDQLFQFDMDDVDSMWGMNKRTKRKIDKMERDNKLDVLFYKVKNEDGRYIQSESLFSLNFARMFDRLNIPAEQVEDYRVNLVEKWERYKENAEKREVDEEKWKEIQKNKAKKYAEIIGTISVYSSVLFRVANYVFVGVCILLLGWLLISNFSSIVEFAGVVISGLWTFLTLLANIQFWIFLIKAISVTIAIIAPIVFLSKTNKGDKVCSAIANFLNICVVSPIEAFAGWINRGFKAICNFTSMFYEENCPPIIYGEDE